MSEFTNKQKLFNAELLTFCLRILKGERPGQAVKENRQLINNIRFSDVIWVTDALQKQEIAMNELKAGVNKFLNLFYTSLNNAKVERPKEDSFLGYLIQNNNILDQKLKALRPLIKDFNKNSESPSLKNSLHNSFSEIIGFDRLYVIKENVLFPVLEKAWDDYRCIKIMWSFHDDIRRNLKAILVELAKHQPGLKRFNRLTGDIFFNMSAIRFRDEKILFPKILETIPSESLDKMLMESLDFDWPFIKPENVAIKKEQNNTASLQEEVDLQTGFLFPEQIRLMMNHLPVDVTYVDENNKVRYYSTPKKRIFHRTKSVIQRDVRNCHPQESVHIVEKIIDAFRKGQKDKAEFCVPVKGEYVYIWYFAIRDEAGNYKGVLEVSQEIGEIIKIEGEKRLLDWEEE